MSRSSIPGAIGSTGKVNLMEPPKRYEAIPDNVGPDGQPDPIPEESEEDFKARVEEYERYKHVVLEYNHLDPDEVDFLRQRGKRLAFEERARLVELRKKHDKADFPELYSDTYRTEEGGSEIREHVREGLHKLLAGIEKLDVAGRRAEEMSVDELIKVLEQVKWANTVFLKLMTVQDPTKRHLFS